MLYLLVVSLNPDPVLQLHPLHWQLGNQDRSTITNGDAVAMYPR
jgi:hypothetical protein